MNAVTPITKVRRAQPVVILDTSRHEDAILSGADRADEPEEAFRVSFDTSGGGWGSTPQPVVTLNGPDGEICIVGLSAIEQFANALLSAERMARRLTA